MSILDRICLDVTDTYKDEIYNRNIVYTTLEKAIDDYLTDFDINNCNLDKDTVYVLEEGLLLYIKNDSFRLYFFKEDIKDYTNLYFHDIVKQHRKIQTDTQEVMYEVVKSKKFPKVDLDLNCWECGALLDEKGNCRVCGCSSEI